MEIRLNKWTLADKEHLIELCNSVDRSYLTDRIPFPYTEADAEWWLAMVAEKEAKEGVFRSISCDGKIVGNISVEQKTDVFVKDAEIGYFLHPDSGSKGIMTEAVRQICEIAFKDLDIIRISGVIYSPNLPSKRVLEKNAFVLEGIKKNAVFKNKTIYDLYIYGKLK